MRHKIIQVIEVKIFHTVSPKKTEQLELDPAHRSDLCLIPHVASVENHDVQHKTQEHRKTPTIKLVQHVESFSL